MKRSKSKVQKTPNADEKPITRGTLTYMFEDMKDFTYSLVKGSETVLRKELGTDIRRLEHAVTHHSKLIKALDAKITGVRTELKGEMQGLRTELKGEMQGLRTELKGEMQGLRTELKEKMDSMESRLTGKIEDQKTTIQNHEERITTLENL